MKITLELLLSKGLDLETSTVIFDLVQLYEYNNQFLDEKGLDKLVKKFKKRNLINET